MTPRNVPFLKGIIDRKLAGVWAGRKTVKCRDSLHFRGGKDYMLNYNRIMVLQHSTAYRFFHHSFAGTPSLFRPNFLILL